MLISLVTLSISDLSFILSFSKILIATCSCVIVCVPILTFPNVPCPRDLPKQVYTIILITYQQHNVLLSGFYQAASNLSRFWQIRHDRSHELKNSYCFHLTVGFNRLRYFVTIILFWHRCVIWAILGALARSKSAGSLKLAWRTWCSLWRWRIVVELTR